jgi:hypothetical protein
LRQQNDLYFGYKTLKAKILPSLNALSIEQALHLGLTFCISISTMKSLFFLATLFLGFLSGTYAQTTDTNPYDAQARSLTEQLTTKYGLNESQSARMLKIQTRKLKNLDQVAALKTSDPAKYKQKLENIQQGTLGSIKLLLNGKAQTDIYNQTQAKVRQLKSAKRKELTKNGMTQQEIEAALLDIYQE